jgi:hypothetical protein
MEITIKAPVQQPAGGDTRAFRLAGVPAPESIPHGCVLVDLEWASTERSWIRPPAGGAVVAMFEGRALYEGWRYDPASGMIQMLAFPPADTIRAAVRPGSTPPELLSDRALMLATLDAIGALVRRLSQPPLTVLVPGPQGGQARVTLG